MKCTHTEENYLKAIYLLSEQKAAPVSTTSMAAFLHTSAASITDMMQKLNNKSLVIYRKYQGVALTKIGKECAVKILRKHLLWEVFLVDKLKFASSEIDQIAEQLEHIDSDILIDRLDNFLGNPYCNPHGIVIPNADGHIISKPRLLMTHLAEGTSGIISAITDDSVPFLQYLGKRNIYLGAKITVVEKIQFDESMDVTIDNQYKINISRKITDNILITL